MLIELKDINGNIFGLNPDHIVITERKKNTDIYILKTLVGDKEVDAATMIYLHNAPTLSLSVIKLDEQDLAKCRTQVSRLFPSLNPHITVTEPISRTFYPKDTCKLNATIVDSTETNITWSSSDIKVATVSTDGLVTFVGPGSAVISATNPNIPSPAVTIFTVNPVGLTLNPLDKTLMLDSPKFQVMCIAIPNETVTWKSINPGVVTIDQNGMVTPVGPGNTTVEVELRGVKESMSISIPAPRITLDVPESLELQLTKTKQITATVENLNNKNVTWITTDDSVVSVVNGLVTAKTSGSAVVKAVIGTIESVVTITVPTVTLTGLETLTITEGESANWVVTCTGTDAKPNLVSQDLLIATVDQNGLVSALKPGSTNLKATVHGVELICALTVEEVVVTP